MFADFFLSFLQILCLLGRAVNIYPLSSLVNQFRDVKISRKTQFIMWFSGKFFLHFIVEGNLFLGAVQSSFMVDSPETRVISPEIFSQDGQMLTYFARKIMMLNNIPTCLLHIYRSCFVSLKFNERDIFYILIGHFGVAQGTGASFKLKLIDKLTPPYKRSC